MGRESAITPEMPVSAAPKERGRFHDPFKYVKITLAAALGLAIGIACNPSQGGNINITESPIIPAATATATVEPSPTATSAPEPIVTPPEVKKIEPFDNGIISPTAYTKAKYVQWNTPNIGLSEAMVMNLEPGEEFRIPEPLQVAATEVRRGGVFAGYRIVAARKDGHQIVFTGYITPSEGIGEVGKDLPAGSVIGVSSTSERTIFPGYEYRQRIAFTNKGDLNHYFPEQTKEPPEFIDNRNVPAQNSTPVAGSGITFFDVPPPPTPTSK